MTKDEMVNKLETFVKESHLLTGNDKTAAVLAMNLLADLKGYKIKYCRKAARPNTGPK